MKKVFVRVFKKRKIYILLSSSTIIFSIFKDIKKHINIYLRNKTFIFENMLV